MRIASYCLSGEPGAFSEAAARQVSADAELIPCRSFEDVFDSVKGGPAGYGVLPIENTIGGSIHRNFDLLVEHHLPIIGEIELPVVHNLLALPGVTMERVRRIYSHPQALAQCDRFLRTLTGVEVIATYDTAGSAKLIAEQKCPTGRRLRRRARRRSSARRAALVNPGLRAQRDALIIGRRPLSEAPADKTTIVFTLANEPGALFKALSVFALRGLDLTKLESRPIPAGSGALFYADLAAARDDLKCARALAHLAEFAPMLRVLGSYPSFKAGAAEHADARSEPDVSSHGSNGSNP